MIGPFQRVKFVGSGKRVHSTLSVSPSGFKWKAALFTLVVGRLAIIELLLLSACMSYSKETDPIMVAPLSVTTMCLDKLQPAFERMHSGDEQRTHAILCCAQNVRNKVSRFKIERQKINSTKPIRPHGRIPCDWSWFPPGLPMQTSFWKSAFLNICSAWTNGMVQYAPWQH
jgi:hypothetical protein